MTEPVAPRAEATPQPVPPDAPAPAEPPRLRQADLWTSDGRHIHVALTAQDENVIVSGHQDSVLVPVDELFTHADDKGGEHVTYSRESLDAQGVHPEMPGGMYMIGSTRQGAPR